VIEGYTDKILSASLVYGIAVHKFIDVMFQTKGNYPEALRLGKEAFMTIPCKDDPKKAWQRDMTHFVSTCHAVWFTQITEDIAFDVLDFNGKPATEMTFDFPYYEDDTVKINLAGTIDAVGKFKSGMYAIRDWKTTSTWSLRDYFKQYELTRQLRIYTLACKFMARLHPDSVLGQIGAQKMGAFIDCIALKQDANGVSFLRSPVYSYEDDELAKFQLMLDDQCKRLSQAVKTGYLPKEGIINGTCEGKFGLCSFWNVCKVPENVGTILLARDFNKKIFDPLKYNE